jgi:hypothetical protein
MNVRSLDLVERGPRRVDSAGHDDDVVPPVDQFSSQKL